MSALPELVYDCDLTRLGPALGARFVPLARDAALEAWLAQHQHAPHGRLSMVAARLLGSFASLYDVHGWLGLYAMHLVSREQLTALVGAGPHERWLDVGAGAGYVTEHARALCHTLVCTETSRALARRLRARGFEAHVQDLGVTPLEGRFDVVSCFNVLDRTAHPVRLLDALRSHVREGGRIVLSIPLPVSAHVHVAGGTTSQEEPLPSTARPWEEAARELSERLFEARGFAIERLSRVPYLSRGDVGRPLYVLDAAVWVLEKKAALGSGL